jgi:HMG (high mobility group) box/HMG-box domain
MVSDAWKDLSEEEKIVYHDCANQDRIRYQHEKSVYTGPWKVEARSVYPPKRPTAPFLVYMKSIRAQVRRDNPSVTAEDISRIVATMWNATPDIQQVYKDKYAEDCKQYKLDIVRWRKERKTQAVACESEQNERRLLPKPAPTPCQDSIHSSSFHLDHPPSLHEIMERPYQLGSPYIAAAVSSHTMASYDDRLPSSTFQRQNQQQQKYMQERYVHNSFLPHTQATNDIGTSAHLAHRLVSQSSRNRDLPGSNYAGQNPPDNRHFHFMDDMLPLVLPHMNDISPVDESFSWV